MGNSIFVRQHASRLEIVSPGGFPPGITPDNILDQQNPRNRRLAEALAKCGMIERSGQGMNLIYEHAIRQGKALPSFVGSSAHGVCLTLHGTVSNPAFVRYIERLGEEKLRSFSTYDFLTLDHLQREQMPPDYLRGRLPGLVAAGAIESIGSGRGAKYILARELYAALGKKGIYTRRKGLDRETNKALLLRHIQENATTGSQMEEFRQVLPALNRSQIQVFLRELRRDKQIHSVGVTKGTRWYPGASLDNCNSTKSEP